MLNAPAFNRYKFTAPKRKWFKLMKLPVKLRNRIYGHYFADINESQWFISPAHTPKNPRLVKHFSNSARTSIKVPKAYLPLLLVNREVRAEAGRMLYNQYLANTEFLFDINYYNGADDFRCIQGICASFAAFAAETETIEFGVQIFTNAAEKSLLLGLADRLHQYAAWRVQRKGVLKYNLKHIDGSIDDDELVKLGLSAEENIFLTYNLKDMPRLAELESKEAEDQFESIIPGFKMHHTDRTFRMFGPLATIDWEYFDFENVPWYLPPTCDYEEFVHEPQSKEGATPSESDGEPGEKGFYDTLELESDEDGDCTDDEPCDEYEDLDALDNEDEVVHEGGDLFDDATIT